MELKDIHVGYFSMEIGIDPSIPTYSGGLGVLAGDTLRSGSDLGLPMIGVTLLYQKGYFKQTIDNDGNQIEEDRLWNPNTHLKNLKKEVTISIKGKEVKVRAWLYEQKGAKGTVPIIFLDTDFEENGEFREISFHLYGGDRFYRLCQEMVLGIAGAKMLQELGCNVKKYHMNEGHSALLTLELYKEIQDINKVREQCVFTTHTPVPAGHDKFEKNLALELLHSNYYNGIENEIFHEEKLNMTYLGLRFSKHVNGVAKKHGEISRNMFPGYDIDSITNGVHSGFWTNKSFKELFDTYVKNWESDPYSLRYVLGIPRNKIWDAHQKAKKELVDFVNKKYNAAMEVNTFTIGFARRAATYKRGDMLFSDLKRLRDIANNAGSIQIIYGGKAHPSDEQGKDIIRRIIGKMKEIKAEIKVCYIEDYDIEIGKMMTSGVDIWLNTPLRPKEASGTSGMKAAHNGVPHFSILDGWWLEGHIENKTGWSIGEHPHNKELNDTVEDMDDMYTKLEYIIVPMYYNHRDDWIEIMRNCIAVNGSFFNTQRMLQQYVTTTYYD